MLWLKPEPVWQSTPLPRFRKLSRDAKFDVVATGAGLTGINAACLLQ